MMTVRSESGCRVSTTAPITLRIPRNMEVTARTEVSCYFWQRKLTASVYVVYMAVLLWSVMQAVARRNALQWQLVVAVPE